MAKAEKYPFTEPEEEKEKPRGDWEGKFREEMEERFGTDYLSPNLRNDLEWASPDMAAETYTRDMETYERLDDFFEGKEAGTYAVAELAKLEFSHGGLDSVVSLQINDLGTQEKPKEMIIIQGEVKDGPNNVGYFARTIERKGVWLDDQSVEPTKALVCQHLEFFLTDPSKQKTGFGSELFRRSVEAYQKLGIERIQTSATAVGRYSWARMGFDFPRPSILDDFRERFADYLIDHLSSKIGPEAEEKIYQEMDRLEHAWEIAEFDYEGVELDVIVGGKASKVKLGKAFMLTAAPSWEGDFDLADSSANMFQYEKYMAERRGSVDESAELVNYY